MAGKGLNFGLYIGSSFFFQLTVKDKLKIDVVIVLEIEIDANQSVG
jgi:hypothetical protein